MSTPTSKSTRSRRSHDRMALIQWMALVVALALGLIAAFILFDGDDGGGRQGAPAVEVGAVTA